LNLLKTPIRENTFPYGLLCIEEIHVLIKTQRDNKKTLWGYFIIPYNVGYIKWLD